MSWFSYSHKRKPKLVKWSFKQLAFGNGGSMCMHWHGVSIFKVNRALHITSLGQGEHVEADSFLGEMWMCHMLLVDTWEVTTYHSCWPFLFRFFGIVCSRCCHRIPYFFNENVQNRWITTSQSCRPDFNWKTNWLVYFLSIISLLGWCIVIWWKFGSGHQFLPC